jgi:hypothetical protein
MPLTNLADYEVMHEDRMRRLAERWRARNRERIPPVSPGVRLALAPPSAAVTPGQREEAAVLINAVEQAERLTSNGIALLLGPVRRLFSPLGREILELYLQDEAYHADIYASLRRALDLPLRPVANSIFSVNRAALRTYFKDPLLSPQPGERYTRGILTLILLSEFLADPILERIAARLDALITDPATRERVNGYSQLVAREEHYHKAWVMLYRDLLREELPVDVVADHLKFFAPGGEDDSPEAAAYIEKEYAPFVVRVLRDKLRIPISPEEERGLIAQAMELRREHFAAKRRYGKGAAWLISRRSLSRWKGEFSHALRRMDLHAGSMDAHG